MSGIHTCSYSCERPECIKAQRDELVARLEAQRDQASGSAEYLAYLEAAVDDAGFVIKHDGGTLGNSNFRLEPKTQPASAQEAVAWYYGFADTGEAGPVTFGGNPGAEAIEWLAQFPDQDATVEVLECRQGAPYIQQGGVTSSVEFDPAKHAEYTDMRGNQFVKDDAPYKDSRTLLLGLNDG